LTERSNLRAAYYRTVNRPELREMAPFAFYNFSINSEILGNTGLKRAFINNADVRWEVFTNKLDMISIGVFHKEILNPIEINLDVSQALIRTFTYGNESRATNIGTEVEVRKNEVAARFNIVRKFCFDSVVSILYGVIEQCSKSTVARTKSLCC
jgi:hypothetical protein